MPTSRKEVRSFLGLAGYYRRFIPGFAKRSAPLRSLLEDEKDSKKTSTKKGPKREKQPLIWTEQCQTAFDSLKEKLVNPLILGYPDFTRAFILETDASDRGLGAVLSQEQDGKRRVIAYASRGLRPTERNMDNYSSFKLELLALKWAVTEKFREYLLGAKATIYTDNNPLTYIKTAKLGAVETRWVAQLPQFDFEVRYRSGKSNTNADALSRMPQGASIESVQGTMMNDAMDAIGTGTVPVGVQSVMHQVLPEAWTREVTTRSSNTAPIAATKLQGLSPHEMAALQERDEHLRILHRYWRKGAPPTKKERRGATRQVKRLMESWPRLTERDGVLFRQIDDQGSKVFHLLLLHYQPASSQNQQL